MDESALIEALTVVKKRFNIIDSNLNSAQRNVLRGVYSPDDVALLCAILANLDAYLSKHQHFLSCATHIINTAALQTAPYTDSGNYYDERRAEARIYQPENAACSDEQGTCSADDGAIQPPVS